MKIEITAVTILLLSSYLFAKPYSQSDLELRKYDATNQIGLPATMVEFGGDKAPLCKLAISNDGRYFFLKKVHSRCLKMINRKGKKIICTEGKEVCKTRSELREFIQSSSSSNSSDIIKNVVEFSNSFAKGSIKYLLKDNKLYLQVSEKNIYRDTKGGIFISFLDIKSRDRVIKKYSVGFPRVELIPKGGRVWSREYKKNITASYLLAKAWSNNWREYRRKRVDLAIDFSNIDRVVADVRVALYRGKFLPAESDFKDQQGYFVKRLEIRSRPTTQTQNDSSSSTTQPDTTQTEESSSYQEETSRSSQPREIKIDIRYSGYTAWNKQYGYNLYVNGDYDGDIFYYLDGDKYIILTLGIKKGSSVNGYFDPRLNSLYTPQCGSESTYSIEEAIKKAVDCIYRNYR